MATAAAAGAALASGANLQAPDSPSGTSGPPLTLQHRHVFGLKHDVVNNVHYAEETQIIYPAGTNTVLWLADQKQQKFFPGNASSGGITCLAVNASKRYLAVAEKSTTGAIVQIFDLVTTKRRKTLQHADCDAPEFVSVAFSTDHKYLITQTGTSPSGKHDWTLMYWTWDKTRLIDSIQVSNSSNAPIRECSFNPVDSGLVTVIGDGILKYIQCKDGKLKQLSTQVKSDSLPNLLCHAWLGDDRLLVCSENGDLSIYDLAGEVISQKLHCSPGETRSVTCVIPYSKGFITGGDDGFIRVHEKSDDSKKLYKRTKSIPIEGGPGTGVRSLALSPTEELLAVSTSTAQLYQLSLLGQDMLKADEAPVFEPVLSTFHSGPILGMDICTRKPLVVTCGADRSVRVWNYMERTCELCKFFNEEAFSVAFHPSGFQLIIGFSDKLRLMNLLMEDMKVFRDIPIKACRECRFSNGGQYFAAVGSNTTANIIQVYKTYTGEKIAELRGHNNKVRSIAWTADDSMIVSTGMDGAVYEYNVLAEGRRVGNDFVLKGVAFSCVIVYTDPTTGGNTMYAVGNDKMLREIASGQAHNIVSADTTLGQIVLSNSAKALFAIAAEPDAPAPIRCYKFPLDGTHFEFPCHSASATRIRITYDDAYLFTCSEDGCLYVFDVRKKDRVSSKRDKENALPPADEILVTRTFLDEKQNQLVELERQVEELSNQIEFQLRHRESYHREEMVELEERYTREIDQERTKYELLREEKNDMEMEYEENIKQLSDLHAKQTQDLESSFQHKMMLEVGRYQKLAAEQERIHAKWEGDHYQLIEKHKKDLAEMQRGFQEKQAENKKRIAKIEEEKVMATDVHEETMRQLEQDTDREIEELKEEKEARLKAEKDDKVKLRGQSGIHKRNHEELKRMMQKREDELRHYEELYARKQERIEVLQKERDHNLREIKDRDRMIGEKEQRIYDLKKQNQELEKFKFVLDYKIKELKAQIDPKNDSITEMKKQIQLLDADLEEYHKRNKQLDQSLKELESAQSSLQEEIVSQKKKKIDCQTMIKRFRTDLHESVQFIQDPKQLKESVTALYKKYVPNGVKKQELDPDIQREYSRQREYLEKSVDSLKKKLLKDSDVHRSDNMRILQENVALIREINELRREIEYLKRERQQQRLNVKSASGEQKKTKEAPPPSEEIVREIENNKQTIADLQRRIDDQMKTRQAIVAGSS
jgi:WD40 repeat protein